MLGSLGIPEVLFIFVIALLVFGPRRLPEIGRTLGKALGEFRRATTDLKRTFDAEAASIEEVARPIVVPEREPEQRSENYPERTLGTATEPEPASATQPLLDPEGGTESGGPTAESSDDLSKPRPS